MLKFLDGYKTRILMVVAFVAAVLAQMGVISQEQYLAVMAFLAPLGGIAIHHAVTRTKGT